MPSLCIMYQDCGSCETTPVTAGVMSCTRPPQPMSANEMNTTEEKAIGTFALIILTKPMTMVI